MSWLTRPDPHRPAPFAPPTVDPARTRRPECRHCHAPIVYVEMAATGKLMPCDTAQRYGDGERSLVIRFPRGGPGRRGQQIVGRVVVKAGDDVLGLEPHWGTCPVQIRKRALDAARKRAEAERAATAPEGPVERILTMVEVPE